MTASKTTVAEDLHTIADTLTHTLGHSTDAASRIKQPGDLYAAIGAMEDAFGGLTRVAESLARAADNLAEDGDSLYSTDGDVPAELLREAASALRALQRSTTVDDLRTAHSHVASIGRRT